MKKGFTILELLVASLLLGMLVTILTMIFNQSSIAWRTGTAVVEDLGDVRECIAAVREEADDLYVWNNETLRLLSPWDAEGELRERAISTGQESNDKPTYLTGITKTTKPNNLNEKGVGGSRGSSGGRNYTVNVKSAGPDREFDTWDDIWSYPNDFEF